MRRAINLAAVAQGALQQAASSANVATMQAAPALPQLVRHMGGHSGAHPTTPLSNVLPPLVALPRKVLSTALSLTGKAICGALTSSSAKGLVSKFADEVVLSEKVVNLADLDTACWSYWLAAAGYASPSGFSKLAAAALPKVASLTPAQATNLVAGFHTAGVYDKPLFDAVSAHVSENFTKYETEELLQVLAAFTEFGHYTPAVFDDIADSITYCNSYLAPIKVPTCAVAKGLYAYAKFSHERADVLLTLSRGISEVGLSKLSAEARKGAVLNAVRAFAKFGFYPEQADAVLYYGQAEPELYSSSELAEIDAVKNAVEAQAGGELLTYKQNDDEDAAHWYAHHASPAPSQAELYVLREALVPKAYSPASLRK